MTSDLNGNLWFTEPGGIGFFDTTTGTVTKRIVLPASGGTQIPAGDRARGPDGNIWFTEAVANAGGSGFASSAVGVINANTKTYIEEFATPAGSQPSGITAGPDGNVWFTEKGAGAIGFVNVAGLTDPTMYSLGGVIPIPTSGQVGGVLSDPAPAGIIAGPAGQLWFADQSGAIGVVNPTHLVVTTPPPSTVSTNTAFGFTVAAKDHSGNVDTHFNGAVMVSLATNPGGAQSSLGGTTFTAMAVNGVATFSGLSLNTAASGYKLQMTSPVVNAPTVGITNPINVVPIVGRLVVTAQPTNVSAGSGFALTVEAEDQFNSPITNYTGTATVTLVVNAGAPGRSSPARQQFNSLPRVVRRGS